MKSNRLVAVNNMGKVEVHAANVTGNDYDTLCGLDADDPSIGTMGKLPLDLGAKINCDQCAAIFFGIREAGLRKTDFKDER